MKRAKLSLLMVLLLLLVSQPIFAEPEQDPAVTELSAEDAELVEMLELIEMLELLTEIDEVAALEDNQ